MSHEALKEIIQKLERAQETYAREYAVLPEGRLLCDQSAKTPRYYQALGHHGSYKRTGISRDTSLVSMLARKEFLSQALRAINTNLNVIKKALTQYVPCDPEIIVEKLSKRYPQLSESSYFDNRKDVNTVEFDASLAQRIATHVLWAEELPDYPDYMPEGRTLLTSRGESMRSKAEVMIAEKLYEYGIPFKYERPLFLEDTTLHPDFTFEGQNAELFYLEFCGMMDSPKYVSTYLYKRGVYESAGIFEWSNMIYVYASGNEMNMMYIDAIIRTRIIPLL